MIALLVAERCTACNLCVDVCPTNVFERAGQGAPAIARPDDCQTCFMCELYCRADALYVDPDCERAVAVDQAHVLAAGFLGRYRRHSGWDEWQDLYPNEQWRMETVFRRAAEAAGAARARAETGASQEILATRAGVEEESR
ncbi:4Fe-4S dicluster domain-containing protein [Phreatobacter sp. AB_2022a]|uniref:4Fe-4S dicluster domain-containing protein n=1 Tax=Phreatobacter sp. AB_2022a TaxID=3003134 RepID=UPI002286FE2B|nr:ferredoxin family protein [Phreatobacter sp. AB_2022a]MCZ0737849.1 ferredoxin family protein [Phreatobacter sp. AB_2022a]